MPESMGNSNQLPVLERHRKVPNMQEQSVNRSDEKIVKLLHSKREAAQMLDVSPRTVDNLIAFKELEVRRIGRRVLIPHSALLNFVRTDHRLDRAA